MYTTLYTKRYCYPDQSLFIDRGTQTVKHVCYRWKVSQETHCENCPTRLEITKKREKTKETQTLLVMENPRYLAHDAFFFCFAPAGNLSAIKIQIWLKLGRISAV